MVIITAYIPEIFLSIWALVLLMACTFSQPKIGVRISYLAIFGLLFSVVLSHVYGLGNAFVSFGNTLIALVASGCILLSRNFLRQHEIHKPEYYVLIIISVLGMRLMLNATTLLNLYVGLEMMSFCLYILSAFHTSNPKSAEAGLKYFILGSLASGIMLYGISLLYGLTGGLSFAGISAYLNHENINNASVIVASIMLFSGFLFKISAVPFHMWTPDVYEGSPTPVTVFMSTAPKVAAFMVLVGLLWGPFSAFQANWQPLLAVVAVATMLVGSFLAIVQTNIKRLLAYSSIAHVGFMLVGVVAGTQAGIAGVLFYLSIYVITLIGLFAILLTLRNRRIYAEDINDLKGLAQTQPFTAFLMLLCMFSLAGVPPLAGFFAKLYVFQTALKAGYTWLVVLGVLSSAIAVFYALKLVKIMYFEANEKTWKQEKSTKLMFIATVCSLGTVWLFMFPSHLMQIAMVATKALF